MSDVKRTPVLQISHDPCPQVQSCELFPLFKSKGAAGLFKIHYCQSDYSACARYKIATTGRSVPRTLLPDGSVMRPR